MIINKVINDNREMYQIIDDIGNEFVTDEPTEALAIAKYNEIKLAKANQINTPKVEQPTIQDLAQAVAELSTIVLGGQ